LLVAHNAFQLVEGYLVQLEQAFALRQVHFNKFGIHTFYVWQNQQLFNGSLVANVAFGIGLSIAPLFGGFSKESHIQHIGIHQIGLFFGDVFGDDEFLNSIGMDAVVYLI